MKKTFTTAIIAFYSFAAMAQTFTWTGFSPVFDFETDTIPVTVTGLPNVIDSSFGISKICFDISHTYKSDLIITLLAPDGSRALLIQGQGGSNQNFTGTCLGMDGVPFALGTPPFTGTFLPAGNISSFNNGQNPNGIWLLLVHDVASSDTGSVHTVSITFKNDPPAASGLGGNNSGPAGPFVRAGIVCPGGAAGCDLLPDMTASAYEIRTSFQEEAGVLRVSNATPNIGYGPLELYGIDSCFCNGVPADCNTPCPNGGELQHIVRQRIYRKIPGTDTLGFYDRDAGAMTYHPEHGHLHVDNWANYTLRTATADPDPRNWPIIGTSVKQSYCLINLGTCSGRPGECVDNNGNNILNVPNNGFGFYTGCTLNQGIYPGNYDVYSTDLNEPIPLDNVCNGNYYIVSITDPNNVFLESDETNNWVAVPITLTHQNAAPIISPAGPKIICNGDSIVLTASVASNYAWSTGDTSRSIVVREGGSYTVSTSCGTSASASAPVEVSIAPPGISPSVSITAAGNPVCAGSAASFTATTVDAGEHPFYQWRVNGVNTGTNSAVYTSSALSDGQSVSCLIYPDISCLAGTAYISNEVIININPTGPPLISVAQTKGSNPLCLGDTASFTATVINGINIAYHWKINELLAGTDSNVYTSTALTNGQVVRCDVTAIAACPVKAAVGNGIDLSSAISCLGAAYPTYYGNGRQQYIVLASELNSMGLQPGPITSIGFRTGAEVGNPSVLQQYSIKMAATQDTSLSRTFLQPLFTQVFGPADYTPALNSVNTHLFQTPFYWDGTSNILIDICFSNLVTGRRGYQTYGTNTPFKSSAYYQADSLSGINPCSQTTANADSFLRPNMIFTSNIIKNLSSNTFKMSVNSAALPSVTASISAGENPQCSGSTTTFKAVPDNTGANPAYQWIKNGLEIPGATGDIYTAAALGNNDTIRCKMTSGLSCGLLRNVQSNDVVIKIALPVYTFTGSGSWNIPSNWAGNAVPPSKLLPCSEIVINPAASGECFLNVQQTIAPGSRLTVTAGKKFTVLGNLLIVQ